MIFKTEAKDFLNVDNSTYTIEGISAKINNSKEVTIGNNNPISFEITFWSKDENNIFYENQKILGNFNKKYTLPDIGDVEVVSGLFSSNKQNMYNSANVISSYYGYILKNIEEQDFE